MPGLDYHDMAHVVLHPNFEDLVESMPDSRIIAFTAHATKLYTDIEYRPTDILLFGPEPGNIPDPMDIMAGPHVAEQVRLPMRPSLRSLNLTNCASIAIYEAWRQLGFKGGAVGRKPRGLPSGDAERTPTGASEENIETRAARP